MYNYLEDFKFLFSLGKDIKEFSYQNFQSTEVLNTHINCAATNVVASTQSVSNSAVVEKVNNYFDDLPFIWWVDTTQSNVITLLKENSFNKITQVTGMELELAHL